jgi:hypothetical protein
MDEESLSTNKLKPGPGWEKARPEKLPGLTYWPFFLAMGLAFLFWGLLTTWVILLAGGLIFTVALIGWINQLRHE